MEIEFTVMLDYTKQCCDLLVACNAIRVWDNIHVGKFKCILPGEKVCASNITSGKPTIKSQNQYAYQKLWSTKLPFLELLSSSVGLSDGGLKEFCCNMLLQ